MARLILEEAGKRRRFKLNPGKLTIGSGDAATLTLESSDVAELHAELLFEGGIAVLVPRPGVVPPKVGGKAADGKIVLAAGDTVVIGGAKLAVEYDDGEGPRTSAPKKAAASRTASRKPTASRTGARSGGTAGAGTRGASAPRAAADDGMRIQRSRRQVKKGMPTWAMLLIFAAALGIGGILMTKGWESGTSESFNPSAAEFRFTDHLDAGDVKGARGVIEEFDRQETLSPDWRRKLGDMKAQLAELDAEGALDAYNQTGDNYLESQLKRFRESQLGGKPKRPAARLFMKRSGWWLERYPEHSGRSWVERMRGEYQGLANMTDPSTYDDVAYEVRFLTQGFPRNYPEAFGLIDEFLARADGEERDEMLKKKAELETEEQDFFNERREMAAISADQAKYPDKYNPAQVVEDFVRLVIAVNSPELQASAEDALFAFADTMKLPMRLQGYKEHTPATFEALMEKSPRLKSFARENGLLD